MMEHQRGLNKHKEKNRNMKNAPLRARLRVDQRGDQYEQYKTQRHWGARAGVLFNVFSEPAAPTKGLSASGTYRAGGHQNARALFRLQSCAPAAASQLIIESLTLHHDSKNK